MDNKDNKWNSHCTADNIIPYNYTSIITHNQIKDV